MLIVTETLLEVCAQLCEDCRVRIKVATFRIETVPPSAKYPRV